jgi:hypothetical protein
MSEDILKPEELSKIDYTPDKKTWIDSNIEFRKGTYCYGSNPHNVEYLGLPHAREFHATDEDWNLPENWKEIIREGLRERLKKYRSLQVFPRTCPFSARSYCDLYTETISRPLASSWATWRALESSLPRS